MKLILPLVIAIGVSAVSSENVLSFVDRDEIFQRMALDQRTGHLFIAGRNKILKLSSNLEILEQVMTGPVNDSQKCGVFDHSCSSDLVLTNNANKVLLVYDDKFLICGSVRQGTCEIRRSGNLSHIIGKGLLAVVPNEDDVNSVAFITKGFDTRKSEMEYVMYVATEANSFPQNSIERNLRISVPTVSVRNLDEIYFSTKGEIHFVTASSFLEPKNVLYISGFPVGNFSYIISNERREPHTPYQSKIAHMCRLDEDLNTYIEIPLICREGKTNFNFIHSAKVIKPGIYFQKSIKHNVSNKPSVSDILVGVFSETSSNRSAMCVYHMSDIIQNILDTAKECLNGNDTFAAHAKYDYGNRCPIKHKDQSFTDSQLLCFTFSHLIITNGAPMEASPVLEFPAIGNVPQLNSLALSVIDSGHTVALVGSSRGRLRKIIIQSPTEAWEYASVSLNPENALLQDMVFDNINKCVFSITRDTVYKVPTSDCEGYTSCETCRKDPHCVWNTPQAWCQNLTEHDSYNGTQRVDIHTGNCPRITSINPKHITMSDVMENKTLNISFEYLPSTNPGLLSCLYSGHGIEKSILVAGEKLTTNEMICGLPKLSYLPDFPSRNCIKMEVFVLLDGITLLSSNIDLFNCINIKEDCPSKTCIVDGGWSTFGSFSGWTECSQTCNGGSQIRTRSRNCTNPAPSDGGIFCDGSAIDTESRQCNTKECPIYGIWTPFEEIEEWSQCSATCGGGIERQIKLRTCIQRSLQDVLQICNGSAIQRETRPCNVMECSSGYTTLISVAVSVAGIVVCAVLLGFYMYYRLKWKTSQKNSKDRHYTSVDDEVYSHYTEIDNQYMKPFQPTNLKETTSLDGGYLDVIEMTDLEIKDAREVDSFDDKHAQIHWYMGIRQSNANTYDELIRASDLETIENQHDKNLSHIIANENCTDMSDNMDKLEKGKTSFSEIFVTKL